MRSDIEDVERQVRILQARHSANEQKILQAGCEGYISKPISIVPFMETIESFLNNHGGNVVKLNKKKPPADSSNLEVS
jgi:hypothetical protein